MELHAHLYNESSIGPKSLSYSIVVVSFEYILVSSQLVSVTYDKTIPHCWLFRMRLFILWTPVGINTDQSLATRLYLIFKFNPNLPKCLDLSSSKLSHSPSSHHHLFFILLHHPLMVLSRGRLVQLISPPMDSLLWPHCELLLLVAAWLSGEADAQRLEMPTRSQTCGIKCYACLYCNSAAANHSACKMESSP